MFYMLDTRDDLSTKGLLLSLLISASAKSMQFFQIQLENSTNQNANEIAAQFARFSALFDYLTQLSTNNIHEVSQVSLNWMSGFTKELPDLAILIDKIKKDGVVDERPVAATIVDIDLLTANLGGTPITTDQLMETANQVRQEQHEYRKAFARRFPTGFGLRKLALLNQTNAENPVVGCPSISK